MQMSRNTLKALLEELEMWLDFEDCEPVEWLVCGGAALALQGLQSRTTRDIDVLGAWNAPSMEVVCIEDFPDEVKACFQRVIDNHPELTDMDARWINRGPSRLAKFGLPEGFEQRVSTVSVGSRLTLHLLGRDDLLSLKLYAAADDLGPRQEIHYQDLKALSPTYDELDRAVAWVRTLPDFEQKRIELTNVVQRLGYDDLAYYI
jgi:hypothetical protein